MNINLNKFEFVVFVKFQKTPLGSAKIFAIIFVGKLYGPCAQKGYKDETY